uniref:Uncharacterized protein n=1 Tax=Tetraselmis chuii TaxID=63592 RepID=A0A7S1X3N4_9CHLO|mmetsp:Transcript_25162/g.44869  ORF Transcript_25162/g.44869 Transcript_25162/m.44869 type:complete len:312 (+) Transcript_25162:47-982(+)
MVRVAIVLVVLVVSLNPATAFDRPPGWATGGHAGRAHSLLMGPLTGAGAGAGQSIQLPLDHFGEDAGAISVRYWVDTQFWSPGGPVLYLMGGEGPASGVPGGWVRDLAEQFGAAQVALEHRFYGESKPTVCRNDNGCSLSDAHLQYLTVDQALADAACILQLVDADLVGSNGSVMAQPGAAPQRLPDGKNAAVKSVGQRARLAWIAFGGSYSGALSAWFRQTYPSLVVGAMSSSGVVDAILDFPQFDEGISKAVGHGCRAQLVRLTQYTDSLLQGSEEERMMAREVMMAPHHLADDDYRYMMADSFSMAVQ